MRLLIIEDNKDLVKSMRLGLNDFQIDACHDGLEGEVMAITNEYDAIVLDLNLPSKDGIDILKALRMEGLGVPIIILSARGALKERMLGLDLGADDYLTKPFEIAELHSRLHALIRRSYGKAESILNVCGLSMNPLSRTVSYDGVPIDLKPKEFDILECIMLRHPEVVSSEMIAEHVYDDSFDPFSSVLRVHIARLRKQLNDVSGKDFLMNIRGKGYFLWEK